MSKKLLANVGNTVVDNYRRYYQEYEGTFITATNKSEDDTLDTSRYIEVTEIWGNTVQDENNLEDIQSVGELYVDDEGNPILDDLGREQYKIEIESCNKNLFDGELERGYIDSNGQNSNAWNDLRSKNYIPATGGVKLSTLITYSYFPSIEIYEYDKEKRFVGVFSNGRETLPQTRYIRFNIGGTTDYGGTTQVVVQIGETKLTSYIPHQSNKTTILLPCQLQKVGDVYDRLYWDSEKGRYVVEKNIYKEKMTGSESWGLNTSLTNVKRYTLSRQCLESPTICDKYRGNIQFNLDEEHIYAQKGKLWLFSSQQTVSELKNYLSNNNATVYYPLQTPQLIETNITEKIQLPCYKEKTHIFVNSTVDATMKVLVPYKEII